MSTKEEILSALQQYALHNFLPYQKLVVISFEEKVRVEYGVVRCFYEVIAEQMPEKRITIFKIYKEELEPYLKK